MRKRGCCVRGCVRPPAYRLDPPLQDPRNGRNLRPCDLHVAPVAQGWADRHNVPVRVKAIPL